MWNVIGMKEMSFFFIFIVLGFLLQSNCTNTPEIVNKESFATLQPTITKEYYEALVLTRRPTAAPTSAPNLPTAEYFALYDLYNATNGPDWTIANRAGYEQPWSFTTEPSMAHPCQDNWDGLHCHCTGITCTVSILALGGHNLTGTIPDTIGNLTYLDILDLSRNNISGTIPSTLGKLLSLTELTLSFNYLYGTVPSTLKNCKLLIIFQVSNNNLFGTFPHFLYRLTDLRIIEVNTNHFTGNITSHIKSLTQLEILRLHINQFTGTISPHIHNLTALRIFDVSNNTFRHQFPDLDDTAQLMSLEELLLGENEFEGTLPNLLACPKMNKVAFNRNFFYGSLPEHYSLLTDMRYLSVKVNMLTGSVPEWMAEWKRLRSLLLAFNDFHGNITHLHHLPNLTTVDVSHNSLSGPIYNVFNNKYCIYQRFSYNQFSGPLPYQAYWRELTYYLMSTNYFTGMIPSQLHSSNLLHDFDVSSNFLTGPFPDWIPSLRPLTYFHIGENMLSGSIPDDFLKVFVLGEFYAGQNYFTGRVPSTLGSLPRLLALDLSDNKFTGSIPKTYMTMPLLEILFLFRNSLTGSIVIPYNASSGKLLPAITNMDISNNELTGSVPYELFKLLTLQTFAASSNCFVAEIQEDICSAYWLTDLDLDGLATASTCQQAIFPSGLSAYFDAFLVPTQHSTIPSCIFAMPNLNTLHLSGNNLQGTLPADVIISPSLFDLSVSHNLLTGTIPHGIQQKYWDTLDLSYNKFSGKLIKQFATADSETIYTTTDSGLISATNSSTSHRRLFFGPLLLAGILKPLMWLTRASNMLISQSETYIDNNGTIYEYNSTLQNSSAVYLNVNRLSGTIPPTLLSIQTISVLEGNIFECDLFHTQLPANDPGRYSYDCGSDSVDRSIYLSLFAFLIPLIIAIIYLTYRFNIGNCNRLSIQTKNLTERQEDSANFERPKSMDSTRSLENSMIVRSSSMHGLVQEKSSIAVGMQSSFSHAFPGTYYANQLFPFSRATTTTIAENNKANENSENRESSFHLSGNKILGQSSIVDDDRGSSVPSSIRSTILLSTAMKNSIPSGVFGRIIAFVNTLLIWYHSLSAHYTILSANLDRAVDPTATAAETLLITHHNDYYHSIYFLMNFFQVIRRIFLYLTIFIVCVLLPIYATLSSSGDSTYEYKYAWSIGSIYLSGISATIVLFVAFTTLIILVYYLYYELLVRLLKEWHIKYDKTKRASVKKRKQRVEEPFWILSFPASVAWFVIILLNTVIMIIVNVLYVITVVYPQPYILIMTQILLALFKVTWNEYLLWKLIPFMKLAMFKGYYSSVAIQRRKYMYRAMLQCTKYSKQIIGRKETVLPATEKRKSKQIIQRDFEMPTKRDGINNDDDEDKNEQDYPPQKTDHEDLRASSPSRRNSNKSAFLPLFSKQDWQVLKRIDLTLLIVAILFNNILAPYISIAVISPDCFYNAFFAPREVTATYTYCSDYNIRGASFICDRYLSETSSYDPPFTYRYQCSSVLPVSYSSVYIYMFILVGVIKPTLLLLLKFINDSLPETSIWYIRLQSVLPDNIKKLQSTPFHNEVIDEEDSNGIISAAQKINETTIQTEGGKLLANSSVDMLKNDKESKHGSGWFTKWRQFSMTGPASQDHENGRINSTSSVSSLFRLTSLRSHSTSSNSAKFPSPFDTSIIPQHQKPPPELFSKYRVIVRIITYYAILISFGAIFPPLAVVACIGTWGVLFYEQCMIGRILHESKLYGYTWYEEKLHKDCYGIAQLFLPNPLLLTSFACLLFAYLIFDTLGDYSGWSKAIIPTICMICIPFCIHLIVTIYKKYQVYKDRKEQAVLKQERHKSKHLSAKGKLKVDTLEDNENKNHPASETSTTDVILEETSNPMLGSTNTTNPSITLRQRQSSITNRSSSQQFPIDWQTRISTVNNTVRSRYASTASSTSTVYSTPRSTFSFTGTVGERSTSTAMRSSSITRVSSSHPRSNSTTNNMTGRSTFQHTFMISTTDEEANKIVEVEDDEVDRNNQGSPEEEEGDDEDDVEEWDDLAERIVQ